MRLISQDKWSDVSYEMCHVCIRIEDGPCYELQAHTASGRRIFLGRYYSFDAAKEEMSRIVTAYCAGEKSYVMK